MLPIYHHVLADPASLGPLTFDGRSENGRWLDGRLFGPLQCRVYSVRAGIADFIGDSCGFLGSPIVEQGGREGWVKSNWTSGNRRWARVRDAQTRKVSDWGLTATSDDQLSYDESALIYDTFAQAVREPGPSPSAKPIILELATGPGGGFLPLILLHDPEAQVLLNDILYPLLEEWQALLRVESAGPNVGFAAADARQLPLRSGTIDVISGQSAFMEILAPERAIAEACRVLRPGGLLVEHEAALVPEDAARLSPQLRGYVQEISPVLLSGSAPMLQSAGFVGVEETLGSTIELSPEEGIFPAMAAREGVTVRVQRRLVTARKPSAPSSSRATA